MPLVKMEAKLVEGGKMLEEFEHSFHRVENAVVESWMNHGDFESASGEVNLQVKFQKHKEYDSMVTISYRIKEKLPQKPKRSPTLSVISDGTLKVQTEIGSNKENPEQEDFFVQHDENNESK